MAKVSWNAKKSTSGMDPLGVAPVIPLSRAFWPIGPTIAPPSPKARL